MAGSFDALSGLFKTATTRTTMDFELTFRQAQATAIKRLNDEIDEIQNRGDDKSRLTELQKKSDELAKAQPIIEDYRLKAKANTSRVGEMTDLNTEMIAQFAGDGSYSSLTEEQVTAINTAKEKLLELSAKVVPLSHPDLVDTGDFKRLKDTINQLKTLTVTQGTIDPAGTEPPTNDNRAVLDLLNTLTTRLQGASDASMTAHDIATGVILDMQAKQAEFTADYTEITAVGLQEKMAEVDELKTRTARILEAWSMAYDLQSQQTTQLSDALQGNFELDPGSVLNLFT